jgi:hypothetical protein
MRQMKRTFSKRKLYLTMIVLAASILILSTATMGDDGHKRITQDLIDLVEQNPEIGNMLEASIAEAKNINPDPKMNPVQSLSAYYDFIDSASELIPQDVLENPSDLTSDQILQSICYFYFLVDQPLPELEDKGLYRNAIQYYEPFSSWLRNFADVWGEFLDTEESWNFTTILASVYRMGGMSPHPTGRRSTSSSQDT